MQGDDAVLNKVKVKYCQIRCVAPRVFKTSKGFWVFLFCQSSECMRGYANHNTTRSPVSCACETGEEIFQQKIQRSCRLGEVAKLAARNNEFDSKQKVVRSV